MAAHRVLPSVGATGEHFPLCKKGSAFQEPPGALTQLQRSSRVQSDQLHQQRLHTLQVKRGQVEALTGPWAGIVQLESEHLEECSYCSPALLPVLAMPRGSQRTMPAQIASWCVHIALNDVYYLTSRMGVSDVVIHLIRFTCSIYWRHCASTCQSISCYSSRGSFIYI